MTTLEPLLEKGCEPMELGQLTLFAGASHASQSRTAGKRKAQADDRWLWPYTRDLFAIFVPDTSSLKMCRGFSPEVEADPTWAAYVAGLVDGDGSIWAQKGRTTQLYPAIAIRLGWKGKKYS